MCKAAVPLEHEATYFAPIFFFKLFSNFSTKCPVLRNYLKVFDFKAL